MKERCASQSGRGLQPTQWCLGCVKQWCFLQKAKRLVAAFGTPVAKNVNGKAARQCQPSQCFLCVYFQGADQLENGRIDREHCSRSCAKFAPLASGDSIHMSTYSILFCSISLSSVPPLFSQLLSTEEVISRSTPLVMCVSHSLTLGLSFQVGESAPSTSQHARNSRNEVMISDRVS